GGASCPVRRCRRYSGGGVEGGRPGPPLRPEYRRARRHPAGAPPPPAPRARGGHRLGRPPPARARHAPPPGDDGGRQRRPGGAKRCMAAVARRGCTPDLLDEDGHVVASIAKRRDGDPDDVEAVQQVETEPAAASARRSRLVADTTRTSIRRDMFSPTRRNSPS